MITLATNSAYHNPLQTFFIYVKCSYNMKGKTEHSQHGGKKHTMGGVLKIDFKGSSEWGVGLRPGGTWYTPTRTERGG